MNGVELAVVKQSKMLYPQEGISWAMCKKSGFKPLIEVYVCVLQTHDGALTEPAEWDVLKHEDTYVVNPSQ